MVQLVKSKQAVLSAVMAGMLLGGCAQTPTNAQKGAGIGAVVGALIGKGTGDHDKSRYAWGAVVGALAGGAIGSYMDKQEQAFKDELRDSGVEVQRQGDNLILIMPGNITFDTGKASISANFYPELNDVANVLNKYEKTTLQVIGHTDDVGGEQQNQLLSESRAASVKAYLSQTGVDSRRVTTLGMGEYQPLVANTDAANRQKNRRVELTIEPLKG